MPLWGNKDQANNKPSILTIDANTIYGVDTTETGLKHGVAHAGWVKVTHGTGPVVSIDIANGGIGYANNEKIIFTGDGSSANATITTDANGTIISVTLNSGGSGFTATPTLSVNTAAGTSANLIATMGGRSNRIHYETLVAMASITLDAEDTEFPDS